MSKNQRILAGLFLLALLLASFPSDSEDHEEKTSNNIPGLDDINSSKLMGIKKCFEANTTINKSCEIYDFNNNTVVDVYDLSQLTQNLTLRTGINIPK